ncbi:hypothetical protein ACBI99_32080 [Nonomuraea sp. ATR24]|uniref:hypothetical protein n=1 Tax=Nonomuraea TaxID=83681 RepID=UPI001C5DFA46|nr:hypothetical protein [Nonomuraea ceibae]
MMERADQLILNYVSKAADAAYGVLRPEQRLDFTRRLRARIEEERGGSQNARDVARVLARFGDPAALVEREARRLADASAPSPASPGAGTGAARSGTTAAFPRAVDDAVPPGVAHYRRAARTVTRTVVKDRPREAAALVVLVVAALLVPFDLPAVAIFRPPAIAWGVAAALVMSSETWTLRDRLIGAGAPMLGYTAGGVVVGGLRVGDRPGLEAFVREFFNTSGIMFMIGAGAGVCWLFLRLLDRD